MLSATRPPVQAFTACPPQLHQTHTILHNARIQRTVSQAYADPSTLKIYTKPKLSYRGVQTAAISTEGVSSDKPSLMTDSLAETLKAPSISKSDDAFLEAGVEFIWTNDVDMDQLNDLFQKVGFPRRDPARLAVALSNTYRTLWIQSSRKTRISKEGQLLGFARATSDGALSATIWDVAVNPAWQRIGLGRAMVERLTASLLEDGIATITLYAEPNVVGLYEKLGFVKDPEGIKGLAFQSKSKQARALIGSKR